jgi:hypothetical protein
MWGILLMMVAGADVHSTKKRPNILMFAVDDLRAEFGQTYGERSSLVAQCPFVAFTRSGKPLNSPHCFYFSSCRHVMGTNTEH